MSKTKFLVIGNYKISRALGKYPDHVWIQHISGEGMDTPIDRLVEDLEDTLDMYFHENM